MCVGIPGRIESIDEQAPPLRVGKASFGGVLKEVNLSFAPEAGVGDYVIVHAGIAISVLDEAEAMQTLALIEELASAEDAGR
jgi:hydrogenase expression/formation protein HypC